MNKKNKFISSKLKLGLSTVSLMILLPMFTISFAMFLITSSSTAMFYLIPLFISIIFLVLTVLFAKASVFFITVDYENKNFIFTNIFNKAKHLLFSEIVNVNLVTLSREGTFYVIEVYGANWMKFGYPFKFDRNKKTIGVIDRVWKKPVIIIRGK